MKVADILRVKGNTLYTVQPDEPLAKATEIMAEKDIGSLVVMEYGDLVGMLTFREVLACIRCGACLNVCPIFKNIGGHAYGTTYQGPIGSVITPHFRGLQDWKHLSGASSLWSLSSV